ncbi:Uncharacterised protein [Mycobacteroides abscessus subsp. abscessus]|nr:Uncharacterised protein [Mycobacteroides abscessus subsp. abscessus]
MSPSVSSGPAMTVTLRLSVLVWPASHTAQAASVALACTMRSGAPGMPIRLPRGNLSS